MEDLINIRLSKMASAEADRLQTVCHFKSDIAIARVGLALALRHYTERDILTWLDLTDKKDPRFDMGGSNYNIGSVDPNKALYRTIIGLFPNCDIPYRYVRALMNMGILDLGKRVSELSNLLEIINELKS